MIETLQLEPEVELHAEPKLLVEWSPRWHDFVTSIGPALAHSEARLAGEAPFGLIPYKISIPTYILEAFLIFVSILVYTKVQELRPYAVPPPSVHEVIYYSGDELPRTEDLGGAETGATGKSGGDEAHHRTQTIRVARGGSLTPQVVDAPNLKLPSSRDAVANLLAIRPNPGPPPSEGMRSSRAAPNLGASLVAPAPNVIHDYTHNGIQLDGLIAPAPSLAHHEPLMAPNYSASVIPPAPGVSRDRQLAAPALAPAVVAPSPNVSHDHPLIAPQMIPAVVAPAPNVAHNNSRSAPQLADNVIAPAPATLSHEVSSTPVQMANPTIVPPPVSAPERISRRDPMLPLPAPAIVAPPPSNDVKRDLSRLASGTMPDPSKAIVPPPPSASSSPSLVSSIIGKIFGPNEVVAPPPAVSATGSNRNPGTSLPSNITPPPAAVNAGPSAGSPRGNRNGMGTSLGTVIAPPSTGVSGGTGTRPLANSAAPALGLPSVVPPPPTLAPGGGTGKTTGGNGTANGTQLSNDIVPPPPALGGGSAASGSGLSRKGSGLGTPLDVGLNTAPANSGGSASGSATIVSSQPGSKVGLPTTGGAGALAMSPAGGDKPGLGGSGGGTGIGRGDSPGAGTKGTGPGASTFGPGRGSETNAHGGVSPTPGPGGAGNATAGNPAVPGVSVSGGSSVVNLGSFGDDPLANSPTPGRSNAKTQTQVLGVTVVATGSSGGAFEPYKNLLRGEKYTTYLDTSLGTAVMEYAEQSGTARSATALTGPQPIRTALPDGLPHTRIVFACVLDTNGNLKNIRVLEPGPADMTAKIVAALHAWKFQPPMRGTQPVEVTAILGFGIDTNDRF